MTIGTPSEFQKKNRILVSTLAAYGGRDVPIGFEWLKHSCEKFGIELTVFGWGSQFVNMYTTKLEYLGYCLWQLRKNYDYVINVDSVDTLFLRPLDSGFPLWNKIHFAAERNCFPIEKIREDFPETGTSYKFLNAGGFTGKMSDVVKTFGYMKYKWFLLNQGQEPEESSEGDANTFTDDQAAWCVEYLQGYVKIDHKCTVFQTLWGHDKRFDRPFPDFEMYGNRLVNRETQRVPLVLHANGSAEYESIYNKIVNC